MHIHCDGEDVCHGARGELSKKKHRCRQGLKLVLWERMRQTHIDKRSGKKATALRNASVEPNYRGSTGRNVDSHLGLVTPGCPKRKQ